MAQVQLDAFQYGAFQYRAVPVWRCFAMTHSSMAQVQYGAFQFGAVPVWRLLRNIVLNAPCRVRLVCVFFKDSMFMFMPQTTYMPKPIERTELTLRGLL